MCDCGDVYHKHDNQLARAKADEVAGFPLEAGPAPFTFPLISQMDNDIQRERSYRMRDLDEYSGEGQREPERFLQEFQRAFEVNPVAYQEDLTPVYIKNYLCTSVRISRLVGHKKSDFLIDLRDSHPKASWPEMEKIYGGRVPRDRYRKPLQPCDRP